MVCIVYSSAVPSLINSADPHNSDPSGANTGPVAADRAARTSHPKCGPIAVSVCASMSWPAATSTDPSAEALSISNPDVAHGSGAVNCTDCSVPDATSMTATLNVWPSPLYEAAAAIFVSSEKKTTWAYRKPWNVPEGWGLDR